MSLKLKRKKKSPRRRRELILACQELGLQMSTLTMELSSNMLNLQKLDCPRKGGDFMFSKVKRCCQLCISTDNLLTSLEETERCAIYPLIIRAVANNTQLFSFEWFPRRKMTGLMEARFCHT